MPVVEDLPGDPQLQLAVPENAAPAENPDPMTFDDADVGVSRPPPTVELNPMNADMEGDEVLPRESCARAEPPLLMLPMPEVLKTHEIAAPRCYFERRKGARPI